ncbi:D-isomer specific 2-hydroxyacid dehydrogenase [Pseudohyphozyma bogoriensis]|nr:D-isomer specific 2-hydroxyacid dehydrogenase [Pseudohyphozyma bogoriensis]
MPLDTLLVLNELTPPSLIDDLKATFKASLRLPLFAQAHFPHKNEKITFTAPQNVIVRPDKVGTEDDYKQADVISAWTFPENLTSVAQAPNLKYFQGTSAGYAHLPKTPFFKSLPENSDITFAHASGIHVVAIGEHCLASILVLYHKLQHAIYRGRAEKEWINVHSDPDFGKYHIKGLRGRTVGIVGYGHIGRETARLAHAFGAHIIALSRSGKKSPIGGFLMPGTGDEQGDLPIAWHSSQDPVQIKEFASRADVVIDTLPSSAENVDFINEEFLKAMKGDALFVNIGRGDTVDQEKLVEALQATRGEGELEGATGTLRIGGASLDVTTPEPLPKDHVLFSLKNVIVTPHLSGHDENYVKLVTEILLRNTASLRAGEKAINVWHGP